MRTRSISIVICIVLLIVITASSCSGVTTVSNSINRETILKNDNTNEKRNQLLTEDIKYLKKELPKLHKNLFANITEKEFNKMTDQLIDRVDQLGNKQVFVELNKIVASARDAHTSINYWDGYSYPLRFWIFDGKVYIVNTGKGLEEMMYSQVLAIDGIAIDDIIVQLTSLISHENESWVLAMLPNYLQAPVFLYGLDIVKNETEAVFTVNKDGEEKDFTVTALEYGKSSDFINTKTEDAFLGIYDKNYSYEYLSDQNTLYFVYNSCADMMYKKFVNFNSEMVNLAEEKQVDKIIVDLRSNTGGNSEILNPFTDWLRQYVKTNPEFKVNILVGRNTFSSGMFAIYRVKEAAPQAVSIGEPTGGALDCYGEVKSVNLPNSQIPVNYSTKYFEFSKDFHYKNEGIGTFVPDVMLQPTVEDYISGNDVVLLYALTD